MNVKNEIEHRKQLIEALCDGKKITKDDKEWLETHIAYSDEYGYPFVVKDVIELEPDREYIIKVELIAQKSQKRMSPTFIIPMKKGCIKLIHNVEDVCGKVSKNNNISVLSTENSKQNPNIEFKCISKTGALSISYECETTDFRGIEYMVDSTFAKSLAMKKVHITNNKIQYSCSDFESKEFDKYIFTVEWNKTIKELT